MAFFGLFKKTEPNALDWAYINLIKDDIHILARKRFQLLTENEYGVLEYHRWAKEWDNYCRGSLPDKARAKKLPAYSGKSWSEVTDFPEHSQHVVGRTVRSLLIEKTEELRASAAALTNIQPLEFEIVVAERLKSLGWIATLTKSTGDQGADIVAKSGEELIVIQCKLYGKPVGNKAVQEVSAARDFYQATGAFVVTNSTFTTSAESLAIATSVSLLHFAELEYHLDRRPD